MLPFHHFIILIVLLFASRFWTCSLSQSKPLSLTFIQLSSGCWSCPHHVCSTLCSQCPVIVLTYTVVACVACCPPLSSPYFTFINMLPFCYRTSLTCHDCCQSCLPYYIYHKSIAMYFPGLDFSGYPVELPLLCELLAWTSSVLTSLIPFALPSASHCQDPPLSSQNICNTSMVLSLIRQVPVTAPQFPQSLICANIVICVMCYVHLSA
jgi:hypothetical protein